MGSADGPLGSAAGLAAAARIDARRAASWIALAAGLPAGRDLAADGGAGGAAVAAACGGLLAVAAIGRLPSRMPDSPPGAWPWLAACRAGWPLAGLVLGGVAAVASGGGPLAAAGLVDVGLAAASAVVIAILHAAAIAAGRTPLSAASQGVFMSGCGMAAALAADALGGGRGMQAAAIGVAWGGLAGWRFGPWSQAPDWLDTTVSGGSRRRGEVPGLTIATALAAMVACFFLAPRFAWCYSAVAVGWFLCLAVLPATECPATPAARRLCRSATGRPTGPGSPRMAAAIALRWVAMLGWPAVVAAVLPAADGGRTSAPLLALVCLAGVAGVLFMAVAATATAGRPETARALVLGLTVVAAARASHGKVAGSPILPARTTAAGHLPTRIDVEPRPASCETPQTSQSTGSLRLLRVASR